MMADRDSSRAKKERPHNREVEHENLRPSAKAGERPRPATEPPGSEESTRSDELLNDRAQANRGVDLIWVFSGSGGAGGIRTPCLTAFEISGFFCHILLRNKDFFVTSS